MELTLPAVLTACLYFCVIGLAFLLTSRGPGDVVTLFLLGVGLFYGFRPFLIVLGLDSPFPEELFFAADSDQAFMTALLAITGYLLVVVLGILVVTRSRVRGWAPFFVRTEISITRARRVTLLLTVLASLLSAYLVLKYGGVGALINAAKVDKSLAGLYILRTIPAVGAVVAAATFLDARRRRAGNTAVICLICAVANAGCVFLWGTRSLLVIIGAIIILGLRPKLPARLRKMGRHRVVSGIGSRQTTPVTGSTDRQLSHRPRIVVRIVVAVLLVVAVAGGLRMARDTLTHGEVQDVYASASIWRQMSLGTNSTYFDAAMLSFRDWPQPYEYRNGEDFINGTLGVVPRFLWKDKPEAIAPGQWFRQIYEPQKVNGWPMGATALWYLNFGWPGVFVGGIVTGLALGVIAAAQRRYPGNGFNTAVAVVVGIYVLGLGWDSETIMRAILWVVPLWLIARYIAPTPARRTKPSAHALAISRAQLARAGSGA